MRIKTRWTESAANVATWVAMLVLLTPLFFCLIRIVAEFVKDQ